jgi:hypothetical protein
MQLAVKAPKLFCVMFHLWAFVSPMEKYSESESGQNKLSDPVQTRRALLELVVGFSVNPVLTRLHAIPPKPAGSRSDVLQKPQSVFSPTTSDFYFFSLRPLL